MIRVRAFIESDREVVSKIFVDSRKFGFPFLDSSTFLEVDFESDTEGETLLVAELDDRIIGFASFLAEKSFLHNFYLNPSETGKGFGRAFFLEVAEWMGGSLTLKCLIENSRALTFYKRLGMTVVGEGETDSGKHYLLSYKG